MAGYNGYSMSNNAVEAYRGGEKPLSKWTKKEIIEAIENAINKEGLTLNCDFEKLKKAPIGALKESCLYCSSWHHTSSRYNKTDFYSLDADGIEELTDKDIDDLISKFQSKKKSEPSDDKWKCAFLEWTGTRKHPKVTEIVEVGIVKGDWFIRPDGSKKKTTARGFKFIEKIQ